MTGPAGIRVVVADDQALVRHSLALMVDAEPDMEVVGQAADGAEALALAASARPDVVLMDIRMPRCDGLEATRRIATAPALSQVRVCVLTMFELDEYVFEALRAGASGFLLKDAEPDRLLGAIRSIHAGEPALAPSVLARVIEHTLRARTAGAPASAPSPAAVDLAGITPREREVLTLIGRGLNNPEIEKALFISRGTLKTHIGHLLAKLGARDRPQLVIAAYEAGLVGG
ncbi:MAG: response regulator transcription factor [Dermatophilus congolensis]|nr:response regulator transcription factor [Dermatophilus congolensis]